MILTDQCVCLKVCTIALAVKVLLLPDLSVICQ